LKRINGYQFYRQKPLGKYIVDFYCPQAKLVIEVDGGQHYSGTKLEKDKERDQYLQKQGLKVLRYSDLDVLSNIEGTIENLLENL
jgi:very-short-patch-repair endonuclease